jgi:hypothetical protein
MPQADLVGITRTYLPDPAARGSSGATGAERENQSESGNEGAEHAAHPFEVDLRFGVAYPLSGWRANSIPQSR